jgi:DNA-binding XRE family transcriptional regulator
MLNAIRRKPKIDKNSVMVDPYQLNRFEVHTSHFIDARLYDTDVEPGYEVQPFFAKKKYRRWLKIVRRNNSWERFRRPEHVLREEFDNHVIIRPTAIAKTTSEVTSKYPAGKINRKYNLLPQSRDKGITVEDENFRGKMFTIKMGKEIAFARTELGMTQLDLGKKINISANVVRNIEHGDLVTFNSENPMVKNLAKALGLPSIKYQE